MANKDLTNSDIERQSILNNKYALEKIQEYIGFNGILFENEIKYTKSMVSQFYAVDERTIERYLEKFEPELKHNGYILIKGNLLKNFKLHLPPDIDVGKNTPQLGLFNFRSFLNLGMLLTESENARILRSKILDIVIQVINEKTGAGTKFINRRDINYLPSALRESSYLKGFTDALNNYLDMGNYKYAYCTDKIYQAIFKEKAKEYKQILKLDSKTNLRDTFYS